ncbi:outer membrane protein [Oryzicola mucosus]|uniref:Porin family protein n=1 Tax=Oryzicola mucosus TaxID=2767425 RepID=A0A8J6Q0G6_9HYPH|nr:outer membrane protein [Oryzicola mucosus]MBD0413930.1 porin family protein [Oryzicola mucosus]
MKRILLATGLILSTTAAAFAADAVVYEPVAAAEIVQTGFVWTGGYVGLQAGYAWGKGRTWSNEEPVSFDVDPDGFIGGIYAGYNYQAANGFVLGIDADATYTDVKGHLSVTDPDPEPDEPLDSATITQELRWSGAVRGRVGYAMDRFLPYVAGGVAFGRIKTFGVDDELGVPFDLGTKTHVGWTVGAGAEYAFTDNVIGRAEYRYTDFGKEEYAGNEDIDSHTTKLKTHDVRLGVAFKF